MGNLWAHTGAIGCILLKKQKPCTRAEEAITTILITVLFNIHSSHTLR